jgi:hypothetical protein
MKHSLSLFLSAVCLIFLVEKSHADCDWRSYKFTKSKVVAFFKSNWPPACGVFSDDVIRGVNSGSSGDRIIVSVMFDIQKKCSTAIRQKLVELKKEKKLFQCGSSHAFDAKFFENADAGATAMLHFKATPSELRDIERQE